MLHKLRYRPQDTPYNKQYNNQYSKGNNRTMNKHLSSSIRKAGKIICNAIPIIVGMLLLTSLAIKLFPADKASHWFGQWEFLDVLTGAGLGSIAAGHPLASYLLGGELMAAGVSLLAVTALIVIWVTVGFLQLPAEIMLLGKRFAIYRNICNLFLP